MKKISLDSVLLFSLVIPIIMTFRISPRETPYWLFGLIFFGLFVYIMLDLLKLKDKIYFLWKHIVLLLIIVAVVGGTFVSAIIVRHETHPIYRIHDMPLQQEIAIRYLLDGKNPYATSYLGTFLEQWHYSDNEKNPALYYFVLMPFYLLFALPFYGVSLKMFGFFDARLPLLFLFAALLFGIGKLIKDNRQRLLAIVLFTFNPAMFSYTLEGRSDIFMYAFLFFGLFLLQKNKLSLSGIPLALAFAVKQSAWPVFPFYLAYVFFKTKKISKTITAFVPFVVTFGLSTLPFFFWNQKAFIDSTILYLSGGVAHGYPISGYGLGMLLKEFGVITNMQGYYPFYLWQLGSSVILLPILILWMKNKPQVSRLLISYGLFLFVFWYTSRYFNNSHLGYLSMVFLTAHFWPEDKKGTTAIANG